MDESLNEPVVRAKPTSVTPRAEPRVAPVTRMAHVCENLSLRFVCQLSLRSRTG